MKEINIKSSTIEKSIDLVKDFIEKLIGPTVEEIGGLFSDNVRMLRLQNQARNIEKIKKIMAEEGLSIKQVNLKVVVPYLEGVSVEEDEALQDMWANLVVNYIDTSKNLTITVYPHILKQLSSSEVKLLIEMKDNKGSLNYRYHSDKTIEYSGIEISNLERLGLIEEEPVISHSGLELSYATFEVLKSNRFYLTSFGYNFLEACKR